MRQKQIDINAQSRTKIGKGGARSTRRENRIPAIIYGGNQEPEPISLQYLDVIHALHSGGGETENLIVNISVEESGKRELALVRDIQHDPLKGFIEHIDFLRVSVDKPITTTVHIQAVGTPEGIKSGGVYEQILREVQIQCLPLEIPEYVEVDISKMEVGDSINISDIPENPQYTIIADPEQTVGTLIMPRREEEEAPAAEEELPEGEEAAEEESTEE